MDIRIQGETKMNILVTGGTVFASRYTAEYFRDKGKKVFLTGHTGFKGTWLSRILILAGAEVTGYSLEPPTNPSIFEQTKTAGQMK